MFRFKGAYDYSQNTAVNNSAVVCNNLRHCDRKSRLQGKTYPTDVSKSRLSDLSSVCNIQMWA